MHGRKVCHKNCNAKRVLIFKKKVSVTEKWRAKVSIIRWGKEKIENRELRKYTNRGKKRNRRGGNLEWTEETIIIERRIKINGEK